MRIESLWTAAGVALAGLVLTVGAMLRLVPDALLGFPPGQEVLARAVEDAASLGCRVDGAASLLVSSGPRMFSSASDVEVLWETVPDPQLRRRLLRAAPPVRLGASFRRATAPGGVTGPLLLEYDAASRLVGASFGFGTAQTQAQPAVETSDDLADRLAGVLLGRSPPVAEETGWGGGRERLYRTGPGVPGVYVYQVGSRQWMAQRQPVPYRLMERQIGRVRTSVRLLRVYGLMALGLFTLGVLLWRLSQRRAGFGSMPVMALLLTLGSLQLFWLSGGEAVVVLSLFLYLVLVYLGVLLLWAASEAEIRETRPGSVEQWDRLLLRQPLVSTGRDLLLGSSFGCALAGVITTSGALASLLGGGYASYLVILPDYWALSTPFAWGIALCAGTTFPVAFGGRVGGRPGAMVGAAVSAVAWSYVMPAAPLGWSLAYGLLAAMAVGWVIWHHGLLTSAVTCVTALSLPTLWVACRVLPYLWYTALYSVLPLLLPLAGLLLMRRAPAQGDATSIAPAYISQLERVARLEAEVDLLRSFQLALLPPATAQSLAGTEIAWRMTPADTVGGDLLDLIEDTDGCQWYAVADVAGHGISCSVLSAFTKAAVTEHAVASVTPAVALTRIRRLFSRLRTRRMMVTLLLVRWDPVARELRVASAGHPPLLLCDVYHGTVTELGLASTPLGVDLGKEDQDQCLTCSGDAVLVAYSDGVVEAVSPDGRLFGYERWPELLPRLVRRPAAAILDSLLAAVTEHLAGRPAADDVTAVVIKLPPGSGLVSG